MYALLREKCCRLPSKTLKEAFEQVEKNFFSSNKNYFELCMRYELPFRIPASMFETEKILQNRIWFNEEIVCWEDFDFMLNCAYCKMKTGYTDLVGIMIRKDPSYNYSFLDPNNKKRRSKWDGGFDRGKTLHLRAEWTRKRIDKRILSEPECIAAKERTYNLQLRAMNESSRGKNIFRRIKEGIKLLSYFPRIWSLKEVMKNILLIE
jgi:hypothetical protein